MFLRRWNYGTTKVMSLYQKANKMSKFWGISKDVSFVLCKIICLIANLKFSHASIVELCIQQKIPHAGTKGLKTISSYMMLGTNAYKIKHLKVMSSLWISRIFIRMHQPCLEKDGLWLAILKIITYYWCLKFNSIKRK